MSNTSYPTSIDSPYDPTTSDTLLSANHVLEHGLANDAIVALETKLGTGSSAAVSSSVLAGTGAGASAWQTNVTGLGLATPSITTALNDANAKAILSMSPTGSAVNNLQIANAAATGTPVLSAIGSDTNVGITMQTKGTGNWAVKGRADGWNDLSGYGSFTYSANNGNKEYLLNTPVDLTSVLSPGHRISFVRGTVPPTQCMAFVAASSQYAAKASPAGITFTGNFTCEASLYINSYTGATAAVITRDNNGTTGWSLDLNASGQIQGVYRDGVNTTNTNTFQSLPLKRWVHVAMAVTPGTKTFVFYLNGLSIPVAAASGTATTVSQGTNSLMIGAKNSGSPTNFFDGYISEARVWSVAQSQASIQANMTINLIGNETNLVALFKGNGNFNDATANANNLTANGGAIATQANNPYNATEYGIITSVTNSQMKVFTGTDNNIPNMALTNPFYSTVRAPQGFPAGRDKWFVDVIGRVLASQASPTNLTWYQLGSIQLPIPTGAWKTEYVVGVQQNGTAAASDIQTTLANATATESDVTMTSYVSQNSAIIGTQFTKSGYLNLSSLATYYLNTRTVTGMAANTIYNRGDNTATIIRAESAYI